MDKDRLLRQSKSITRMIERETLYQAYQTAQNLIKGLQKELQKNASISTSATPPERESLTSQILELHDGQIFEMLLTEDITFAVLRNRINSVVTYIKRKHPDLEFKVRQSDKGFKIWKKISSPTTS